MPAEWRYVTTVSGVLSVQTSRTLTMRGVRRTLKLSVERSDTAELSTPYCTTRKNLIVSATGKILSDDTCTFVVYSRVGYSPNS